MELKLTRRSVAAGDDVDAPHKHSFRVPSGSTLAELLDIVLRSGYLASISGGKATWSVHAGARPGKSALAVVAQEWDAPKFIAPAGTRYEVRSLSLYFEYHAQRPPEEVFAMLARLEPEDPAKGESLLTP
jgi:hypothetical protein